ESNPKVAAMLPEPEYDFLDRGIRYGPHNLHEPRPGSYQDQDTLYLTYFAGGLRVYDVSDPLNAREIACFVPDEPTRVPGSDPSSYGAIRFNDVTVAGDGLVYVTDRFGGGLYVVEHQRT